MPSWILLPMSPLTPCPLWSTRTVEPTGSFISHLAMVPVDPSKVEIVTTSPNGALKVDEAAKVTPEGVVADVGDGCHPATTTLIGNEMGYEAFRSSLREARITPRNDRCRIHYTVGYLNPVTTYRAEAQEAP